jgi:hypothetical protein
MEPSELVTVFTSNHLADAEILKNALEAEGIRCELDGQNQASLTGLLEIRGLVRAEDKERAEEILADHVDAEPEDEESVIDR